MTLVPHQVPTAGKASNPAGWRRLRLRSAEENEHGDGEADEARSFGKGEAKEQRTALTGGSGRVAQGTCEVIAEDVADTDTGATEGDGCDTRTDHLCCFNFHLTS